MVWMAKCAKAIALLKQSAEHFAANGRTAPRCDVTV
jgi:hypothetical protein